MKTPKKTPNAAQSSNNTELMYTSLPLLVPSRRTVQTVAGFLFFQEHKKLHRHAL